MKMQEQISTGQLSVVFFIFLTGSSIINIPQPLIQFARNGSWISLLISCSISLLCLSCILYMHNKFPNLTFIEYSRVTVGNWMTYLLAIPFISFQFHMTSGIVLDIGIFMTTTMMRETPIYVFNTLIFLLIYATVRMGIEVIARMFVFLTAMVMVYVFIILILASINYDPSHLVPVMPYGIKPVLLGTYFSFGFPYVEIFLFSMLLPFVSKKQNKRLMSGLFIALVMNGLCLVTVTLCTLMTYGPIAADRRFSMFQLARTIELYDIIQRIESLIGISLIVASYMKATIVLFVLNLTFTHLLKLQDDRLLILPLCAICCFLTFNIYARGGAYWARIISVIHPLWGTFGYFLPVLLVMIVYLVKSKWKNASTASR
ncbi:endospore germination permease [Paenibacillus sp. CGMCC 1.16610]|uniref:Endospore germination permease n=1 Tax=Paenibacillus anseongense TaxID=2682845 RepID=A0ABW9UBP7_9BACL|nr:MULTISPECIES: endospore germination permease [Paenibacillus]MBA2943656.1 endospore germination permease [Paenibacillus sp. CGMCC 1.16610]MVQ37562.1 endospore germination permease [Paenibacillus anseongense]